LSRPALYFAIPGDPDQRTGGYIYDRRVANELERIGWELRPIRLDASFPQPSAAALDDAVGRYAALPDGALVLADGLALGAMPAIARREKERLRLVALVHHPLGYEAGLRPDGARALVASERDSLAVVRAVIVTSTTTRDTLVQDFAVPAGAITVAVPGTEPGPLSQGSGGAAVALLAVGSVIPRKGFAELVRALAPLLGLPWTLTIAGSLERSDEAVGAVRAAMEQTGLAPRVRLAGELDAEDLGRLYHQADLFVSSSSYEGFGMALAEALARGLPIVAVAGGAIADWLDPRASILARPDDKNGLTEALRVAIADPDRRAGLRAGAVAARQRLPSWADCAAIVDASLRRVLEA
jgi:glycosyltransferase involved in cell wall biosynthesis